MQGNKNQKSKLSEFFIVFIPGKMVLSSNGSDGGVLKVGRMEIETKKVVWKKKEKCLLTLKVASKHKSYKLLLFQ